MVCYDVLEIDGSLLLVHAGQVDNTHLDWISLQMAA